MFSAISAMIHAHDQTRLYRGAQENMFGMDQHRSFDVSGYVPTVSFVESIILSSSIFFNPSF
jgi:hypothetical protein